MNYEIYAKLECEKRMNNYTYKITVFTPTYNRAYIIKTLYQSLLCQTFTDFEWLIVDDGSTDNTEQLFKEWMSKDNLFPIRYVKQKNGGKCRAINHALDLAQGELFFTVDSDDYLTEDALEKIVSWEQQLPRREKYCGVAGNLGISINETPNIMFEGGFYEGDLLDRYKQVDGERAIVLYTDIHRQYRYPEFEGEKFMTEAVVWNRIARDGYKIRFYNDIIWVYEYKEDGLTKAGNELFKRNPYGYALWLREKSQYTGESFLQKLKLYYSYVCDLADMHSNTVIADSMRIPQLMVVSLKFIHFILNKIKGEK